VLATLAGNDVILCQITTQAKSNQYSVVLEGSDFDSGGLNQPSRIRPNRLFTGDSSIILYATANALYATANAVIAILNQQ
jgi:mRNA interferase MazF